MLKIFNYQLLEWYFLDAIEKRLLLTNNKRYLKN